MELLLVSIISATVAAIVSISIAFITHRREIQFKRKDIIASAYKTAIARIEMLYRIHRRSSGDYAESDSMNIRDRFHSIQEDTEYYKTMLSLESKELGERYAKLVEKIQEAIKEDMMSAWTDCGDISGNKEDIFNMSVIEEEKNAFLTEAQRFTRLPFTGLS